MDMDLDRLNEFTVIARCGSIKKAALELEISSATLSARLIRFETHLGTPLFCRKPDKLLLTAAGEQLLPSALEILTVFNNLRREMHTAQKHIYHQLRIAVSGTYLPPSLGPFLNQLNKNCPGIQLSLLDDSHYGIVDGLESGEVDLYFAPVMEDFAPKGLAKVPISTSKAFVTLPQSHPLAGRAMISFRELDGERFILYPRTAEPAIQEFQLRNLQASGIQYTLCDRAVSPVFYKMLVTLGSGVLLRPLPMTDLSANTVCLPVTDLPHPATTCFFYDKSTQKADVLAFARDYQKYSREVSHRKHRKTV